jgi:hypothetical protein
MFKICPSQYVFTRLEILVDFLLNFRWVDTDTLDSEQVKYITYVIAIVSFTIQYIADIFHAFSTGVDKTMNVRFLLNMAR